MADEVNFLLLGVSTVNSGFIPGGGGGGGGTGTLSIWMLIFVNLI